MCDKLYRCLWASKLMHQRDLMYEKNVLKIKHNLMSHSWKIIAKHQMKNEKFVKPAAV